MSTLLLLEIFFVTGVISPPAASEFPSIPSVPTQTIVISSSD